MERAGKFLAKTELASHEDLARAAWSTAVGPRIARHATAKALVRGNLVVEVEDAVWQKQLFYLRHQILPKLASILGAGVITDVEFRIAQSAPRRPPTPAVALGASQTGDEADAIEDRLLRRVYKQARKRASA